MAGWAETTAPRPATPPSQPAHAGAAAKEEFSPDDFLGQVAGDTHDPAPATALPASGGDGNWQDWVRQVVAPYLAPSIDYARQARLLALVDEVVAEQMRSLLHNPAFQALEGAWREVGFLVRRLETDEHLQIYLLDLSKGELTEQLNAAGDLRRTALYRLLIEQSVGTAGGQPWSVLLGRYTFEPTLAETSLLVQLSRLAAAAGAPFLAAASDRCLGCASLAQTPDENDWALSPTPEAIASWDDLRRRPDAAWLGLAVPRCLLRLPYGKDSDPVERFEFEEMPAAEADRGHESYLWGNPAVVCVCLLAEAFQQRGWTFRPGMLTEVDGLPLHVYQQEGEGRIQPCAEVWLTERTAAAILARGLMPLVSIQGRDAIRMAAFQSLASPSRPLAGRWSS